MTAEVVDARGNLVPHADNPIHFTVSGPGRLTGTDNGREENATGYTSPTMAAFNGLALAVVGSTRKAGAIRLTATADGLPTATVTLASVAAAETAPAIAGTAAVAATASAAAASAAASGSGPIADASYSGAPTTLPAMMLDGNLTRAWSNYYDKPATANVKAVSVSNPGDWVSLSWSQAQRLSGIKAFYTTGGPLALPASVAVTYWDGHDLVPVRNLTIAWATASNEASTLTFDRVSTRTVRLTMTSTAPGTASGFLQIAELQVITG